MCGCGVRGCAKAFAVAGVCCVCVVAERSFFGALGMLEISLHDVNGGGVLVYNIPLRIWAGAG